MLYIAEKPSVGRAIAEQLGHCQKSDGYITCGKDTVTWCFGHLLELAEPDAYLPADVPEKDGKKLWRWEDLPIVPDKWLLLPKKDCKKQIKIIGDLLKKNSCVVNCGDPDREGQLLIDELLEYLHYAGEVKRYWCNAVDPVSIKRALVTLKPNSDYQGMKNAAEARGRADWLVGMNMSRAYTMAAHSLITIGRVQTPTLKLVVDRDREIKRFRPKPFFTVKMQVDAGGVNFTLELVNDDTVPGLDSENRLVSTDSVRKILTELQGTSESSVTECRTETKHRKPPLGYSLADIQATASSAFGYSAEETLQLCQSLYEKKLTTYPRTDCNYLPSSQYSDAEDVLKAISATMPELVPAIQGTDLKIRTKIWNDAKTTAHHAIIPTMTSGDPGKLSDREREIYRLIALRYVANFYADFVYEQKVITAKAGALPYTLRATGKTLKAEGWKKIMTGEEEDTTEKDSSTSDQALPDLKEGARLRNVKSGFTRQTTTTPQRFTEGSLIKAMENIYRYTEDPEMKKILKDGDGIGTSATRAGIIADLRERKFLATKGKSIVSTEVGQSVIDKIPEKFKSPAMTAIFERILVKIEKGEAGINDFLKSQTGEISREIAKIKNVRLKIDGVKNRNVSEIYKCQECGGGLIRRKGDKGFWWGCENYPKCKKTYQDDKGKPKYR